MGTGERVLLRLALPEGVRYRLTTVGMIQFAMIPQSVGLAREEEMVLSGCSGEGGARVCSLEHRTTRFEAEPPYGKLIEADEAPVLGLVTRHTIAASGAREGDTAVEGDAAATATDAARALSSVHRFACIEFPREPVGVGATWTSTCDTRVDGRLSRRTTTWELASLVDDPDGGGKRAEIRETGTFRSEGKDGAREGRFAGTLFFWVDLGEPHLLRESLITEVVAEQGASTKSSLNLQFAKVDPRDPTKVTRTDGKPFPEAPPPAEAPTTPEAPVGAGAAEAR